jgi:hypothetical protein
LQLTKTSNHVTFKPDHERFRVAVLLLVFITNGARALIVINRSARCFRASNSMEEDSDRRILPYRPASR